MAKKIFVRATLSTGKRWYIDYTIEDPESDTSTRHRRDFGLNDVPLEHRKYAADCIIKNLEVFVGNQAAKPRKLDFVTVADAVNQALEVKLRSPRANTHRSYKSIIKTFLAWADKTKMADTPAPEFSARHAHSFFDDLRKVRKYRPTTLNNYLNHLRSVWNEMISRELAGANPWSKIKPERVGEKLRREFTPAERAIVARAAMETDYWMFRGILLQYYCFIRPVELTRLRMRDFDLEAGVVTVQEAAAKTWKKSERTIPKSVLHYFKDGIFDKQPGHYYMYGLKQYGTQFKIQPSTQKIDDDRMYRRHEKLLARLLKAGKLKDIEGLSWYSWKDTGITAHAHKTSMLATRDQADHSSMDMTLIYYRRPRVNAEYQGIQDDLLG